MLRNKIKLVIILMMAAVTTYMLFSSCDRKPNEPVEPVEELTDYKVWFTNLGGPNPSGHEHVLYCYHPTTRELDSFYVPWGVWTLSVSADGQRLYPGGDIVVDANSLQLVAETPYDVVVAVSPNNEYVAVCTDSLLVLRTSDYSVVFHDSLRAFMTHTWFSTNSDTLYTVYTASRQNAEVMKVTFTDNTGEVVERKPVDPLATGCQIIPTPDGSKWLVYGNVGPYWTYIFKVYDFAVDSIIFSEIQRPGGGKMAMTPDGRYAFYGNPGTISPPLPPPDTSFTVFDIEANAIDRIVPIQRRINGIEAPYPYFIGQMVVTPDGRWLVMLSGVFPNQLIVYDLKKEEWVDYYNFGCHNISLSYLTVQIAP